MNIVLLSGGSGKRLWPLSNDIRSKQFLKIFRNGVIYESMVQRVYRQIISVDATSDITIATSESQVSSIKNQLGDNVNISIEPCRKDTFPAIVLSSAYLHFKKNLLLDDIIIVSPIDSYVGKEYFENFKIIEAQAKKSDTNIVLMGIKPTYPSEKYGYIIPETEENISNVIEFKEKPNIENAKLYIENNALWNGGIFAFKLGYLLDVAHRLIEFDSYDDLFNKYNTLEKISFDYAVVEKEPKIKVVKYEGAWKDLGTWNTLTEEMDDNTIGKVVLDRTCKNVHVINELNVPVVCMGLENSIVASSVDGILIADKFQSNQIKDIVKSFGSQARFAEKSWGTFQVLDDDTASLTVKIVIKPKCQMSYHCHEFRDEIWSIVDGQGIAIVDGKAIIVNSGDTIIIKRNVKHLIKAITKLKIIEIQTGDYNMENDKVVYNLDVSLDDMIKNTLFHES